jgi:hypothetical protein
LLGFSSLARERPKTSTRINDEPTVPDEKTIANRI